MNQSSAPTSSHVKHAIHWPLRLSALLLLVLAAVAACGVRPGTQTNQGPTSLPAIVSQSAMVCEAPAHSASLGGCVVQDAATGISLRVTNTYADVTSTVVQLHDRKLVRLSTEHLEVAASAPVRAHLPRRGRLFRRSRQLHDL